MIGSVVVLLVLPVLVLLSYRAIHIIVIEVELLGRRAGFSQRATSIVEQKVLAVVGW